MLVLVDIKRLNDQLAILHQESEEITIILDILTKNYPTSEEPEKYLKQMHYMQGAQEAIRRRIDLIEDMIDKFQKTNEFVRTCIEDMREIVWRSEG